VPYRAHLAHPARATPFGRMSGLGCPPADQPWPILRLGVLSQWLHRFLHVCDHMAGQYDVASAEKSCDRARGVDRSVTVALSRFAGGLVWKPFFGTRQRCGQAGVLTGDGGHPADCYLPVRWRCLHPGQQQGRRWPSSSSSWVRRMRRSRVISCLASSTQQMNSLRARGVMSFQASSAAGLAISALRRSPGSLCSTPPGSRGLLTGPR
jgi:hypothetical protein